MFLVVLGTFILAKIVLIIDPIHSKTQSEGVLAQDYHIVNFFPLI